MLGRFLSTVTIAAIAGAIGFGAGVYVAPSDQADEFRTLVNAKIGLIGALMHHEQPATEPKTSDGA